MQAKTAQNSSLKAAGFFSQAMKIYFVRIEQFLQSINISANANLPINCKWQMNSGKGPKITLAISVEWTIRKN